MKIILWGAFALVALLWTAGAALTAQLVQWSAQGLASVGATSMGAVTGAGAVPTWLGPWIDVATWTALMQSVSDVLAGAAAVMPTVGDVAGWLVPVVWVTWALGLLVLLGLTLAASVLMRRFRYPVRVGPQTA